ncbi:hypothetical protein NW756_004752 [Fusarium oxysporum]|nr:hypothetical protein NW763_011290 [Fusarium oxysporum]KAJ4065475.1 hypothetical protein NW753_003908 [Fusarium oxysporum]KAJ4095932.1 hypothetical protein NW756_004752 [Fusarium oxysporum]
MIISPRLAILFLALTAKAQTGIGQASNFNISSEIAQSYVCNETCQQVLAIANAADLETLGTAFDFDFYATADNFSTSKPGDLLKLAAIDSSHLDVPAGMTSFRFQYTSRDLDESPVPSTGFIAFPFAKLTQGRKFSLVAYAHGTIGVFRGYLRAFNSKGADGAASNVQNIFNVLTGQGQAASGQSGATPLVQIWHDQSYDKMYSQDAFILKEYLDDFDKALWWAFSMAGFALACQIIALQDLADKSTTHEEIQDEVEQLTSQFTANVNEVFETAYKQFPAFVKKFKLSYQDEGSNLTNLFRMWRNNSHVKNYTPIAGGPHLINPLDEFPNSGYPAQAFEVYPTPCDDDGSKLLGSRG